MKVLIIPDVHLKPWIFDQAEDIMRDKGFERAVFIGDLVDDWDHESDVGLYEETLKRAVEFAKDHPDMLWCYGNHDLAYLWDIEDHPGFSEDAQDVVCEYFNMLEDTLESPENMAVMHRIAVGDGLSPRRHDRSDTLPYRLRQALVDFLTHVTSPSL